MKKKVFLLFLCFFISTSYYSKEKKALYSSGFWDNDKLILSNYPESFKNPGLMFADTLVQPVRCMFHHRNVSSELLNLGLIIMNPSTKNATVQLILGIGGPSTDIVFAGHKAAESFWDSFMKINPVQINVTSHTTAPLFWLPVKPQQTVSGVFRLESNVPVYVKLIFFDNQYPSLASLTDMPNSEAFRPAIYEESVRRITYEFDTKDNILGFQIGGIPFVKDLNRGTQIKGNYGLIYHICLKIKNSEKEKKMLRLFAQPAKLNSVDRGVFLIQGKLKTLNLLKFSGGIVSAELLDEFYIQPDEIKQFDILTFPQAGCFYPIDMTLRVVK